MTSLKGMSKVCELIIYGTFALLTLATVSNACLSFSRPRGRTETPTETETTTSPTTTTTTTTPRPNVTTFPIYACPPNHHAWYCLNNAKCFAVKINSEMLFNCECAVGFEGPRCEFKERNGFYIPTQQRVMLEKASIFSGATLALLLVFICCMFLYRHHGSHAKEKLRERSEMNAHENGGLDAVDGMTVITQLRPFGPHHYPIMTLAHACRR